MPLGKQEERMKAYWEEYNKWRMEWETNWMTPEQKEEYFSFHKY